MITIKPNIKNNTFVALRTFHPPPFMNMILYYTFYINNAIQKIIF